MSWTLPMDCQIIRNQFNNKIKNVWSDYHLLSGQFGIMDKVLPLAGTCRHLSCGGILERFNDRLQEREKILKPSDLEIRWKIIHLLFSHCHSFQESRWQVVQTRLLRHFRERNCESPELTADLFETWQNQWREEPQVPDWATTTEWKWRNWQTH